MSGAPQMNLVDRRNNPVDARVEAIPIPRGAQLGKAAGVAVGGIAAGGALAFLPPHLPYLIILPSVGLFLAFHLARQVARVGDVHGTCLACGAAFTLPGSGEVWSNDTWLRCPHCQEPYRVELRGA